MSGTPSWIRSRAGLWAAASVASLAIAATAIALAMRNPTAPSPDPGTGPVTPGGMAMCVELYSLDSLKNREIAFAGTVSVVEGDRVTFTVDEWFTDGSTSEITLEGAQTIGGMTSVGEAVPLEPGSKLLVAGDGGFAWSCGFTQPYDEGVAAQWRATLS